MSEEMVWVVDGYMDCLRERKKSLVEKDAKRAIYPKNHHIFDSAKKAAQFMVSRAEKDLAAAVNEVNSQEDRVWRLKKKYSAKLRCRVNSSDGVERVMVSKCTSCDKDSIGTCENCGIPICGDHEEGRYDDVYTCKDLEACSGRISISEASQRLCHCGGLECEHVIGMYDHSFIENPDPIDKRLGNMGIDRHALNKQMLSKIEALKAEGVDTPELTEAHRQFKNAVAAKSVTSSPEQEEESK